MGALRIAALMLFLGMAAPAAASPIDRWSSHISEASSRFGIPHAWVRRVMQAESGGRTHLAGRPIVSRAGAMGLMQLMPATWRQMRALHGLGADPHDPRDNILAGTAYLRAMYDRFGYPGLFAAYNAGPARYASHLATGRSLPGETRAYVAMVAVARASGGAPQRVQLPPAQPPFAAGSLFAVRTAAADPAPERDPALAASAPSTLFVRLGTASPR